jgi:WD40 repeat protein
VAFSPNSQYLASLGASNDGFLYVWSINSRNGSATLYASNKCTSNITQIAWMGSSLVTVGTRHVKVWRTEGSPTSTPVGTPVKALAGFFAAHGASSSHRILQGRNCLLGSLLEGTFTAVAAISQSHAIVCSETGDICLLDDTNGSQRFFKVANVGFPISAATISPKGNVIVAGKSVMATFDKDVLLNTKNGDASPISRSDDSSCDENLCVALAPLGQHVVAVDDRRIIRLIHPPSEKQNDGLISELQLPAHGGPVLGVRPLSKNDVLSAAFFTWSADGTILFWTADGVCKRQMTIELEQTDAISGATVNELRVVRTLSSSNVMITGDKIGVMRYCGPSNY